MDREKTVRPFGWRDKVGYMFGDFGNDFYISVCQYIFDDFLHKGIRDQHGTCGNLIPDSTMHRCIYRCDNGKDRRPDASEKRRKIPSMAASDVRPVAISSFLMYQSSLAGASMTVKVIYMFVTYILWGSIFILRSISHTAPWHLS